MPRAHVKKGDEVVVIAGSEKGRRGKILSVNTKKQRIIVERLAMIKRHTRKNQRNPQGAIIEREGTIHISNVMLASRYDERAAARGLTPAAETEVPAQTETPAETNTPAPTENPAS
jgi:large subunit ribosomal protein L24